MNGAARAAQVEDAAFISDFRDLTGRRLCRACGARHCEVHGPAVDRAGGLAAGADDFRVRRGGEAVRSADAAGPDPEVPVERGWARAGAEQAGRPGVGEDQGSRQEGDGGHDRGADEALCAAPGRAGLQLHAGFANDARVRGRLRLSGDRRPDLRHCRHQARHGIDAADGSPAVRRRGVRQDGSRDARGVQGRAGLQAGGGPDADDRAEFSALSELQEAVPRAFRSMWK